ncbi:hypothetical protein HDU93_004014 [Gonapodya sp. JEL0774]|nr:hypothetical protein HDU93_004014 [Gonapodya sp. JEL0774]
MASNPSRRRTWTEVYEDGFDDIASSPFPAMLDSDIEIGVLAPYLPSSRAVVKEALDMALTEPGLTLLELGSGDGRFCIAAVQDYQAKLAIGLELDEELTNTARQIAEQCGVAVIENFDENLPRMAQGACIFAAGDLTKESRARTPADVVVVCLLGETNSLPAVRNIILEHYHRGARILAILFDLSKIGELRLKRDSPQLGVWMYQA